MVSFIALISLYLTGASSALNFHSPVHIIRPINDVHAKCERDVEIFCTPQDRGSELHDILPEEASKNEDDEDKKLHRRLTKVEHVEVSKLRTISLKIGLTFNPEDGKESSQHAKDTQRFLNYGPNTDNCLWNTFDAQKVSNECASALTYINDSVDRIQAKYDSESDTTTTYMSISFSGGGVSLLILCYVAYRIMSCDEDDKEDDDTDRDSINRSENIAFVAVPLTVV